MAKLGMLAAPLVLLTLSGCADFTPSKMQQSHVFHEDLRPAGIPAEWVLQGSPRARVKYLAEAPDDAVRAALWDCTAGTFEWHFGSDELVHILEGEVEVRNNGGPARTLKPGDVAYFPAGMKSVWHVDKYVKKLAVVRNNRESLVRRAHRKLTELLAAL